MTREADSLRTNITLRDHLSGCVSQPTREAARVCLPTDAGKCTYHERHRPEETTLYPILVQEHIETFFAQVEAETGGVVNGGGRGHRPTMAGICARSDSAARYDKKGEQILLGQPPSDNISPGRPGCGHRFFSSKKAWKRWASPKIFRISTNCQCLTRQDRLRRTA